MPEKKTLKGQKEMKSLEIRYILGKMKQLIEGLQTKLRYIL